MSLPQKEHYIIPLLLGAILVFLHFLNIQEVSSGCIGVQPYTLTGLKGVFTAPLVHSDNSHLIGNVFPLMALIFLSFQFYGKITYWILIIGWFMVGLLVWAFPIFEVGYSNTCHIGASGLVYVFAFFLVFGGIFNKRKTLINLTLIIIVGFGSMFWGVFPEELLGLEDQHISWQGHLSGAIVGIFLSYFFRKSVKVQDQKFDWEESITLSDKDEKLWNTYLDLLRKEEEEQLMQEQQKFFDDFYDENRRSST